jgi:hypothetical protein
VSEPSDKDLPDEQQLDEYLKGGSSVSQQYRQLHDADVPSELDGFVLRQARDAVKTVRPAKSRVWMRWTAPLALAASAVLVVSIVIESGVQDDALVTPASAPAPAAHAPMEAQRKSEATDNDALASTAAEGYSEHGFVAEEPRAVAEEQATHLHVPPAEVAVSHEAPPPVKLDMPSPDESRRERRAPPPPDAIASSRSQAVEADKAARVLSQQASDRVEQAAAAEQQLMQDVQPPNAGPRNTVSAPTVRPTGAAPIRQKAEEAQYSDPDTWLRDIRELRIQGKREEADWEWLRFQLAFPNHVVAESDPARGLK